MRVCSVSTYPPTRCGIGDYTMDLAKALVAKGIDIHVITYKDSSHLTTEVDGKVQVHRVMNFGFNAIRQCLKWLRRVDPDIVHFQSSCFLHPWMLNLLPRFGMSGYKFITTVHDTATSIRLFHVIRSLRVLYSASTKILVHTNTLKRFLMQFHGCPEFKISVIPHGVDVNVFCPRTCHEVNHSILFFGFTRPGKGLEYLIHAMLKVVRRVPDARLIIAGGLPSRPLRYRFLTKTETSYPQELRSFALKIGADRYLEFKGYVPPERVPEVFSSAKIVVFPYRGISQSGPMHKALASGKPIVATRVSGVEALLRHKINCLLVNPCDSNELADAILELLSNNDRCHELSRAARESVMDRSWNRIADQTVSIYREVV